MTDPQNIRDAGAANGAATGAIFMGCFGTIWVLAALSIAHRLTVISAASTVMPAIVIIAIATRIMRATAGLSKMCDPVERAAMSKTFNIVNTVQWVSIVVAIVVLNIVQHQNWIMNVIMLIVGVHFFPLAASFRAPAHYVTGGAITLWALTYPHLAHQGPFVPIGPAVTGFILILSACFSLLRATQSARRASTAAAA